MEKNNENLRHNLKTIIQNLYSDKEILKKNKFLASLLKKRVSIPVIGMLKSGKSTFLNAIIGENILPTDLAECTYSTTKIQNSKESKPESLLPKEIKAFIELKNKEEREKQIYNGSEFIVKKNFLAFNKTKEKLDPKVVKSIEFIDLPGINDNFKEGEEIKMNSQEENILNYKFSRILDQIDIDGFILVLKYNDKDVEDFFKSFKSILFQSKKKFKLAKIINEKRFLIVVNQAKIQDENFEENKKKILDKICSNFLIPKSSNIISKILDLLKISSNEFSNLIYDPSDKENFEKKCKELNVVFVESKIETLTIADKIEEKRKDLMLKLNDEDYVKEILSSYEKTIRAQQQNFEKESNFEELIPKIYQLVEPIYLNEIYQKIEESCSWNLDENLQKEWEKELNEFANYFESFFENFHNINIQIQNHYEEDCSEFLYLLIPIQDNLNTVLDEYISFLSKKIKISQNFQLIEKACQLKNNQPAREILLLFLPDINTNKDKMHFSFLLLLLKQKLERLKEIIGNNSINDTFYDPLILKSLINDIETNFYEDIFSFITFNRSLIQLLGLKKKD